MKTKTKKAEQRGRKKGDGILKNIDKQSSLLQKQITLAYGWTAGNLMSERLRWIRAYRRGMARVSANRDFVEQRKNDILARFQQEMAVALYDFNPGWFQKMADAMTAEISAQDAYAMQKTLLEIVGGAKPIKCQDIIFPENAAGEIVKLKEGVTNCKMPNAKYWANLHK